MGWFHNADVAPHQCKIGIHETRIKSLFWINDIKEADGFHNPLTQCSNMAFPLPS